MKKEKIWIIIDFILLIIFLTGTTNFGQTIIGNNISLFGPTTFQGTLDYFNILFYGGTLFIGIVMWIALISLKKNWQIGPITHQKMFEYSMNIMKKILYACFGLGGLVIILSLNLELTDLQLASFFLFSITIGSLIDNHIAINSENGKIELIKTLGTIALLALIVFCLIFLNLI
jgi:hypothetical protein